MHVGIDHVQIKAVGLAHDMQQPQKVWVVPQRLQRKHVRNQVSVLGMLAN